MKKAANRETGFPQMDSAEHKDELLESIRRGRFKPQPVRRKEIPKPDGGVRKLETPVRATGQLLGVKLSILL